MRQPTMAVTNRQQLKDLEQQQLIKLEREKLDLIRQMETPQGRRYVWSVLESLLYQQKIVDANAAVYGKVALQARATDMVVTLKKNCRDLFYRMEIENDGLGGD